MIKAKIGDRLDPVLYRLSFLAQKIGLRPNSLTFIGTGINGAAAWALAEGHWGWAAGLILLAGFFDVFDGAMARNCREQTAFGSFLDSVLDRYSDLLLLVGLLIFYAREGSLGYLLPGGAALVGTAVVPYARARAETWMPRCNVGILERPERILLLFLGSAVPGAMPAVLWILAVFTNVTVVQRVLHTRKYLEGGGGPERGKTDLRNPKAAP
jgi:CDP-diacylglycerol---glycerol-3-phosphate 3-phosphatidyltransferase